MSEVCEICNGSCQVYSHTEEWYEMGTTRDVYFPCSCCPPRQAYKACLVCGQELSVDGMCSQSHGWTAWKITPQNEVDVATVRKPEKLIFVFTTAMCLAVFAMAILLGVVGPEAKGVPGLGMAAGFVWSFAWTQKLWTGVLGAGFGYLAYFLVGWII